jgi:uncharacterized protein (TIGR02246 family)
MYWMMRSISMLKIMIPLFVSVLFAATSAAQSATPVVVVEDFLKAWNSHDAKAFDRLFTEDAIWVPVAERRFVGHSDVIKEFEQIHTTWAKKTTIIARDIKLQTVRGLRYLRNIARYRLVTWKDNWRQYDALWRACRRHSVVDVTDRLHCLARQSWSPGPFHLRECHGRIQMRRCAVPCQHAIAEALRFPQRSWKQTCARKPSLRSQLQS